MNFSQHSSANYNYDVSGLTEYPSAPLTSESASGHHHISQASSTCVGVAASANENAAILIDAAADAFVLDEDNADHSARQMAMLQSSADYTNEPHSSIVATPPQTPGAMSPPPTPCLSPPDEVANTTGAGSKRKLDSTTDSGRQARSRTPAAAAAAAATPTDTLTPAQAALAKSGFAALSSAYHARELDRLNDTNVTLAVAHVYANWGAELAGRYLATLGKERFDRHACIVPQDVLHQLFAEGTLEPCGVAYCLRCAPPTSDNE